MTAECSALLGTRSFLLLLKYGFGGSSLSYSWDSGWSDRMKTSHEKGKQSKCFKQFLKIYYQCGPKCKWRNIVQHTSFKSFFFQFQVFLHVLKYFHADLSVWELLSQSLRATECNSQEIIAIREKNLTNVLMSWLSLSRENKLLKGNK